MSDHEERDCRNCGSLLHFEDACPRRAARMNAATTVEATCVDCGWRWVARGFQARLIKYDPSRALCSACRHEKRGAKLRNQSDRAYAKASGIRFKRRDSK